MDPALIEYLASCTTESRYRMFRKVAACRTRYITVVLEDIYQSQNASAVLRSCECFGVQDVHIVENKNSCNLNPDVSLGSEKWLNLQRYHTKEYNTRIAFDALREKGYRIVATSPHPGGTILNELSLEKGKTALVFGTEMRGLTTEALEAADEHISIPMYGFTESFNISVSVALVLYELVHKLKESDITWILSGEEQDKLVFDWLKKSIRKSDLIIEAFRKRNT
jgi:tRNA (guanosine-2'-O-)-methyltransferase